MNPLRLTSFPIPALWIALALFPHTVTAQQQLPNLRAHPAFDISVQGTSGDGSELRFAASTWNAGDGPLELIAGGVSQGRQFVYQRIYNADGSYEDRLAGDFVWHQDHDHFHFEDYASYVLQPVTGTSMRNSSKISFCVLDTRRVDGSLPGSPDRPVYAQCGNFYQGLSVGWADIYGSHLTGQSIDLTNLHDGDYRLLIEVDPKNRLVETDESDNLSCVLLRLSPQNRRVDVLDADGCDDGDDGGGGTTPPDAVRVTGISPAAARVGTTVGVTISGSGFRSGMAVAFENGPAPKPEIYGVTVVSSSEITATVSVRRRGRDRSATAWDLHVGGATLPDAFTVMP